MFRMMLVMPMLFMLHPMHGIGMVSVGRMRLNSPDLNSSQNQCEQEESSNGTIGASGSSNKIWRVDVQKRARPSKTCQVNNKFVLICSLQK
jgi:hypothetical protein